MKSVEKPDAGNPHVRFDERGGETERIDVIEADTAPFLDSTQRLASRTVALGRELSLGAWAPVSSLDLRCGLGFGVGGIGLCGAIWPRRSRSGGLKRDREAADEPGVWAGSGEGDPDARGGFDDACPELEKAKSDGGELGGGEHVRLGNGVTDGKNEPIGGGMQDQAHLVARGLRQEVRSEASWVLCNLIRFSACSRAQ
jgi:hypothetical protein